MELPPGGLSWREYVERWVDDCGGWIALADSLISRAQDAVEIALDPQTVERGLRRLATRGHKPGGQYGRWMLRFFGFTSPVERWVRWLGSYHGRFADLPCSLRLEMLALWNRPPVAESPLACWIDLGAAIAHYSRLDLDACRHWLARAEKHAGSPEAEIEVALFAAQLAADAGGHDEERLVLAETLAASGDVIARARIADLRSRQWSRPHASEPLDLERARACYESIPESPLPFAAFRKHAGLAYCAWRLGDDARARELAAQAVDDAGDGGLVRMRIQALNMLSRLVPSDEAEAVNARAHAMAASLEDEELLRRVNASLASSSARRAVAASPQPSTWVAPAPQ